MRPAAVLITLLLTAGAVTASSVQDDSEEVARLWGVLVCTNLTVDFDRTPARQAIGHLAEASGLPIVGRFADDPIGYGIEPQTPITLELSGFPMLTVLEEVLEQCGPGDCTWQIRRGFVEVGPRSRLSVPAARERRTYYIRDFLIDMDLWRRLQPEFLALNVVEDIVENIEPDSWDYGQIDYDAETPDDADRRLTARNDRPPPSDGPDGEPNGATRRTPPPRRYVTPMKIASIRYWRDVIIVTAPDYLHRQINGYPKPIPPAGTSPTTPSTERDTSARISLLFATTPISVSFDGVTAREAFERLGAMLDTTLMIRYPRPRAALRSRSSKR
jgi:hypothetical protein